MDIIGTWAGNFFDCPSPFGLGKPSALWLRVLAEFDPDFVVFPSQTRAVFRCGRRAKLSRAYSDAVFKTIVLSDATKSVHPDTFIAYRNNVVLCSFDLPPAIIFASPDKLVEQLRARDQWQFRTVDGTEKAMDALEAQRDAARQQPWKDENRQRAKAMSVAWRYRTGARISLVGRRAGLADHSPVTSASSAIQPAAVSPPEA